jgi:glycosyltransferase involved in cell wall biosynthesis
MCDSIEIGFDVRRIKADIYHGQAQHSFGFSILKTAGLSSKSSLLSTAHGSMWGLRSSTGFLSPHERVVTLGMENVAFKNSDKVICVGNSVKEELMEGYKIESSKLSVIQNGIDPNRYSPKSKTKKDLYGADDPSIVTFFLKGGFRKGCDIGLRIFTQLEIQLGAATRDVIIQAIVDDHMQTRLAPFRSAHLKTYLTPDNQLLEELLSASDVLVFPSRYEGCPFILLEAMAARNVVLASNIAATRDIIENGVQGFLLDQDEHTWTRRIINLLENQSNLQLVQEKARRTVVEQFHFEAMCRKTLGLYESLL